MDLDKLRYSSSFASEKRQSLSELTKNTTIEGYILTAKMKCFSNDEFDLIFSNDDQQYVLQVREKNIQDNFELRYDITILQLKEIVTDFFAPKNEFSYDFYFDQPNKSKYVDDDQLDEFGFLKESPVKKSKPSKLNPYDILKVKVTVNPKQDHLDHFKWKKKEPFIVKFLFCTLSFLKVYGIPDEMFVEIFKYMNYAELLLDVGLVTKRTNNLVSSEVMWKYYYCQFFREDENTVKKPDETKTWKENSFIRKEKTIHWVINDRAVSIPGQPVRVLKVPEDLGVTQYFYYTNVYVNLKESYKWKLKISNAHFKGFYIGLAGRKYNDDGEFFGEDYGIGICTESGVIKGGNGKVGGSFVKCPDRWACEGGWCQCSRRNLEIFNPQGDKGDIVEVELRDGLVSWNIGTKSHRYFFMWSLSDKSYVDGEDEVCLGLSTCWGATFEILEFSKIPENE